MGAGEPPASRKNRLLARSMPASRRRSIEKDSGDRNKPIPASVFDVFRDVVVFPKFTCTPSKTRFKQP